MIIPIPNSILHYTHTHPLRSLSISSNVETQIHQESPSFCPPLQPENPPKSFFTPSTYILLSITLVRLQILCFTTINLFLSRSTHLHTHLCVSGGGYFYGACRWSENVIGDGQGNGFVIWCGGNGHERERDRRWTGERRWSLSRFLSLSRSRSLSLRSAIVRAKMCVVTEAN
ncbi:hypothetical protein Hanom_Chr16g01484991 [Helianthus anomalus]